MKKFCQVTIFVLGLWIMGLCTFSVSAATNLLVNGSGENGMEGWTDPDHAWEPSTSDTVHNPVHGNTFFWPSKMGIASTRIYQDVDVSKIKSGTYMCLSGYLANFDQSPHDQATLRLDYLDKNGKVLASDQSTQRNPQWSKHTITLSVPSEAVKARIYLIAQRFVGTDNDAYFDDISFYTIESKINEVIVTGKKSTAKPGEKVQLSASDGYYKKATDYIWSSSYDKIATVDANGLVTFQYVTDPSLVGSEVIIYAKNKKTGITGKYYMNSSVKNEPMKVNPTVTKPATVKNFRGTYLILKWDAYKNADGYKIYRYNTKTEKYKLFKKIADGKQTTYKYPVQVGGNDLRVRAYKNTKEYNVKNSLIKRVTFQWNKNTKATGYQIYQWDSKSEKYKKIKTISNPNTTSYTASGLKKGVLYKFKIRSYKSVNGQTVVSKFSQELSLKP